MPKAVKEAIVEALNDGEGAVAFFLKLKNSRSRADRAVFANICARIIPHEVTGPNGAPLIPNELSNFELARRTVFLLEAVASGESIPPTTQR